MEIQIFLTGLTRFTGFKDRGFTAIRKFPGNFSFGRESGCFSEVFSCEEIVRSSAIINPVNLVNPV
jgi:hypothetical protein